MSDEVKGERVAIQQYLSKKARDLPRRPGCYLMKNASNSIIYVGKAKDLRSRVSSYFQGNLDSPKTQALVNRICEFEFMICANEAEALVLENNLIKRHSPRYNIRLKDDKSYPYLVIDWDEPFPRLKYLRRPQRKKNREVIGPFATGQHVGEVIRSLTKLLLLRDCTLTEFRSRKEPCLLYQMHQCSAPCVKLISEQDYEKQLQLVLSYFKGRTDLLLLLEQRMHQHAATQEFERAAHLRDHWLFLTDFQSKAKQKHAELEESAQDLDVISYFLGDQEVDMVLSVFRGGLLLGQKSFHFKPFTNEQQEVRELLISALTNYYQDCADSWPAIIFVPDDEFALARDAGIWEQALEQKETGAAPKIKVVSRSMSSFAQLAREQAMENQRVRHSLDEQYWKAATTLKELLQLEKNPERLECYDIAIWQGQAPTASRIRFLHGRPDRSNYRHYHLELRPEGNNDFAMMREVLTRRLQDGELPDLIILDGGKGQLGIGLEVMKELNLNIPIAALAKEKLRRGKGEKEKSEERLYLPGRSNPIILAKHPELMHVLIHMRDEAHRFSRRLHHRQMRKEFIPALAGSEKPLKRTTRKVKGPPAS